MNAAAALNMTENTRLDSEIDNHTSTGNTIEPTVQQRNTAQYIADMILELRNMAKAAKLFAVMVPLEYAYYEAFSMANRVAVPPMEIERLRKLEAAARESAEDLVEDY